jgi:hypothetical protein
LKEDLHAAAAGSIEGMAYKGGVDALQALSVELG